MKKINILLIFLLFLVSCSGFKEAGKVLRNEKTSSTDEFLVKKREPLILPPDYKDIPEPESIKNRTPEKKEKLKEILKAPTRSNTNKIQSSSIEESILKSINK
tara:strand:+ start:20 stop:328 length:309 start_codon:yes stop_codon:yes gene_type:complete